MYTTKKYIQKTLEMSTGFIINNKILDTKIKYVLYNTTRVCDVDKYIISFINILIFLI